VTVNPVGTPFLSRPANAKFEALALTAAAFAFAAAVAAALAEGEAFEEGNVVSVEPATLFEETD